MISVEADTIINGEEHKIIRRTHYHKPIVNPAFSSSTLSIVQIKNDSVYLGDDLILDFSMTLNDSLYLENVQGVVDLQLAIDSITSEEINGISYTKWHGQKLCIDGTNPPFPYEPFTILESVGQIENGFLFWNTDNCSIGGGLNKFKCYKNGDFTYPPFEAVSYTHLTLSTICSV